MVKAMDLFKDYRPWKETVSIFTDKARGIMAGGAIGDALGWVTAEKPKIPLERKCGMSLIKDYVSWEPLMGSKYYPYIEKIRKGEYTDDTQLTLCTARSLSLSGDFDPVYFSKIEFPLFLEYARSAGGTTKGAAENLKKKKVNWYNNFFSKKYGNFMIYYRNAGSNGVAMRISPLAITSYNNRKRLLENIWKNAIISHGHPRAIIGAILHGLALSYLLKVNWLDEDDFLNFLVSETEKLSPDFPDKSELYCWVEEWNKCPVGGKGFESLFEDIRREVLEKLTLFEDYLERCDREVFADLGCFDQGTKRSGTGTVMASLYLFCKYYVNPEIAIEKTVNMIPADTDTTGSFTGQLCGALYGYRFLPERWKRGLQDEVYISSLADRLARITSGDISVEDYISVLSQGSRGNFSKVRDGTVGKGDEVCHEVLGPGVVEEVDIQPLPGGKRNTYFIRVRFYCGQSCKFRVIRNK